MGEVTERANIHEPLVDHFGIYCSACDHMGGADFVAHALRAALDQGSGGHQEGVAGDLGDEQAFEVPEGQPDATNAAESDNEGDSA